MFPFEAFNGVLVKSFRGNLNFNMSNKDLLAPLGDDGLTAGVGVTVSPMAPHTLLKFIQFPGFNSPCLQMANNLNIRMALRDLRVPLAAPTIRGRLEKPTDADLVSEVFLSCGRTEITQYEELVVHGRFKLNHTHPNNFVYDIGGSRFGRVKGVAIGGGRAFVVCEEVHGTTITQYGLHVERFGTLFCIATPLTPVRAYTKVLAPVFPINNYLFRRNQQV
eukprot:sb/3469868/